MCGISTRIILIRVFENFGPQVYPMGFIVIALVSPSVGLSVRFEYLGNRSLVFSEALHEVRG